MKCLRVQVYGKVQGVWFRASTKKEAEKLSLTGNVRNLEDGSVLIHAEGKNKDLETFLNWCKKGPEFANVTDMKVVEVSIENFNHFKIIRS